MPKAAKESDPVLDRVEKARFTQFEIFCPECQRFYPARRWKLAKEEYADGDGTYVYVCPNPYCSAKVG